MPSMLYLTESQVQALLPMREAIRLMGETFEALKSGAAQSQVRRRLVLPTGSGLNTMAGAFGKYFGTKIYSTHVRHGAHFFFLLFDAATARPLALMEADHLGQIRTGAVSGYATDLLSRPGARTLAIIGSGFQARTQVEAILQVRPIRDVRVWSRNAERCESFAAACSEAFGVAVRASRSAEAALGGAEIAVTATYSKDPVLRAEWVDPQAHVNAVGSNNPARRELPSELVQRASLIAVDSIEQSRIEAGDLLLAFQESDWNAPRLKELKDLSRPERPDGLSIFKSNGLGVEDVAVGGFVYEGACAAGIGSEIYS